MYLPCCSSFIRGYLSQWIWCTRQKLPFIMCFLYWSGKGGWTRMKRWYHKCKWCIIQHGSRVWGYHRERAKAVECRFLSACSAVIKLCRTNAHKKEWVHLMADCTVQYDLDLASSWDIWVVIILPNGAMLIQSCCYWAICFIRRHWAYLADIDRRLSQKSCSGRTREE